MTRAHLPGRLVPVLAIAASIVVWGLGSGAAADPVRVDFLNETTYATFGTGGVFGIDGVPPSDVVSDSDPFDCPSPGAELFDYADRDDLGCVPSPNLDGVFSNGGTTGWGLRTVAADLTPARALGFNFSKPVGATSCVALTDVLADVLPGACPNPCTEACGLQVHIQTDNTFKAGATTEQPLIRLLKQRTSGDGGWEPAIRIDYVAPLAVCAEPSNPERRRLLQTATCGQTPTSGLADVYDIRNTKAGQRRGSGVLLGRWDLPMQVRLFAAPVESTPPPPPSCLPKGDPCDFNSDCCSLKCSGQFSNKTCK